MENISLDLLEKYDVQGPRYTSYPPAPFWKNGMGPKDYETLLEKSNKAPAPRPLSFYFHLPFCEKLCLFCACTSIITGPNHTFEDPYTEALLKEIEWLRERVSRNRPVVQVHLGGGTPNYFSPENLERLISALRNKFQFAPDVEMGVELDPRTIKKSHLSTLKKLGFNRMSMGVQDFDPAVQKRIRRIQPREMVGDLVEDARNKGFASINFDLIYGLPGQTPESFGKTIRDVVEMNPDRLAVYSYAFVPWMKKYQEKIKEHQPAGRQKFELFLQALRGLTQAGYEYIGMDHFSRPGDELTRARANRTLWRNFQGYTTKAGTDLIGLGLSAISQVADGFMQNDRQLYSYQKSVLSGTSATVRGYVCSTDDVIRARVIQNLMCHAVLIKSDIETEFGLTFDAYFAEALSKLKEMEKDGLVNLSAGEIRPTSTGRVFLRNLAMPFDAHLPKPGEKKVFSRTV